MRARAVRDYRTQYANPIRLARGDVVALGARDTEWPAFAWTTNADGNAGWAPVDWLQPRNDGHAVALRDYSAQELDVRAGDTVLIKVNMNIKFPPIVVARIFVHRIDAIYCFLL